MKKLIILAFTLMANVFAGGTQELFCRNQSLLYCLNDFNKRCEANNSFACYVVGALYEEQGLYSEAIKYYEKVFPLQDLEEACKLGDDASCSLANLYYLGKGVQKELNRAATLLAKSCELEYGYGCLALGAMYEIGGDVKQNRSKAKELYGKACNLGVQLGCDSYKELRKKGY